MISTLPRRAAAASAIAALALVGVTACGDSKPSKASLQAKIKTESSSITDTQASCLADVLLKYGRASDLKKYVDGKIKVDDIKGPEDKVDDAQKAQDACLGN